MSIPDPNSYTGTAGGAFNNASSVSGNYFGANGAATNSNPVNGVSKPSFNTVRPPLRYPIGSIDEYTDFMLFEELNYKSTYGQTGGLNALIGGGEQIEDNSAEDQLARRVTLRVNEAAKAYQNSTAVNSIILPIPGNISDTNAVTYGEDNLNSLAAMAVGAVASGIQNDSVTGGIGKILNDVLGAAGSLASDAGMKNPSSLFFGSMAANVFGANTSFESLLSRATGQIINPNLELLFTGVALRSFTFDFNFVPRSKEEGERVKEIIRVFKIAMSPRREAAGNGLFIKAPNVFRLTYKSGNKNHPFLNRFKIMALENMAVNYTASGQYATYDNGTPVHMQMQLAFKELNPVYAEDHTEVLGVGY